MRVHAWIHRRCVNELFLGCLQAYCVSEEMGYSMGLESCVCVLSFLSGERGAEQEGEGREVGMCCGAAGDLVAESLDICETFFGLYTHLLLLRHTTQTDAPHAAHPRVAAKLWIWTASRSAHSTPQTSARASSAFRARRVSSFTQRRASVLVCEGEAPPSYLSGCMILLEPHVRMYACGISRGDGGRLGGGLGGEEEGRGEHYARLSRVSGHSAPTSLT